MKSGEFHLFEEWKAIEERNDREYKQKDAHRSKI
jgi:hypothetical protein